ncbi:MAG: DPP IV N-terminal domain-containing protein [Bacteroidales bacterium]|nr:DPP IV N-terminal domain-containing protein [Bacteroidales bacterium]
MMLFLLFFMTSVVFLSGQEKMLTPEDANYMNPSLMPPRLSQLKWMGNSDYLSYTHNNCLIRVHAANPESDTIVTLDDLNSGLTDMRLDSIERFPEISYTDQNKFRFIHARKVFIYDIISRNLVTVNHLSEMEEKAENIEICEETNSMAYTVKNNLFLIHNSVKYQVTQDEDEGIVNGQPVHRVEFGIEKGIFWSPKGKLLAFYRMDETMVTDYPLVDISERIAAVKPTKYPMAGMASHEVILGIFNLQTRQTVFIKTGEPRDQYLTSVTWDPSEKYIYIALLNRDQNHLKLNRYDVSTGNLVNTLFEEKSDKYVEPEHPLYFLKTNPGQFLWFSERDGYQHLYLYSSDGELIKQVTSGPWVVTGFMGLDEKEKCLFITATKESPIENHIYKVVIKNGGMTGITADHGSHDGSVSGTGTYILDIFSSTGICREYKVYNNGGEVIQVLLPNKDPLAEYKLGEMSVFPIKADDGTDLYCRLIKPAGFEEGRKYPVFIYVYGGPHSQLVSDSWMGGAQLFLHYMAQQGFVVFTLDNRGTANRGLAFEQAIFRNLGTIEVNDQMKGVEYLKSLDFVDPERIAVNGWSYGGFMTLSMVLKNPGVFKAAVAGGPVIDWKYYEVMYGERYMDTPESNPEGYEASGLLNYVENLTGDILIIHGTMDPTVVWQNSLAFIQECVKRGKQVDYFVYPGHPHNVRGKDRVHLNEKISLYVKDKLNVKE